MVPWMMAPLLCQVGRLYALEMLCPSTCNLSGTWKVLLKSILPQLGSQEISTTKFHKERLKIGDIHNIPQSFCLARTAFGITWKHTAISVPIWWKAIASVRVVLPTHHTLGFRIYKKMLYSLGFINAGANPTKEQRERERETSSPNRTNTHIAAGYWWYFIMSLQVSQISPEFTKLS